MILCYYDIGRILEELPDNSSEDFEIPDSVFVFFDNLIIFDLHNKKTYITAIGQLEEPENSISNIEECMADYVEDGIEILKKSNNK